MDLLIVPIDDFQNFLLCLSRVLVLITAIPVFAGSQIAGKIKIGLSFATAIILFPLMAPYTPQNISSGAQLGFLIVNEVILGGLLALSAQLIFTGVSFGGTIIGYQMGFAAANIFDPQTTQQLSLMSQFINILALLFFLTLDIHHYFFHIIIDSYIAFPPGYLDFSTEVIPKLMEMGSQMFVLGVKFSAPVLALLLLSNLVLGILARVFPQLNVFMLSFPINIGIALLVIGLTLNTALAILSHEFDGLAKNIFEYFIILGNS
ncbi:MAG: flagellar biosynthetic protein FliR [Bacteroidetes bacterium]|nr:flagellar biosynthetic protein FliR [Bacteroidota bacterium]